jgi:hypothetical protein
VQEPILIYTTKLTSRLDYICKFIFRDLLQVPFVFTTSFAKASENTDSFINYSDQFFEKGLQIIPHPIIAETTIQTQQLEKNTWQDTTCFFTTNGSFVPFDVFSASFYLITRYEEYIEHKKDDYNRFPHTCSLAYQWHFLHEPLVDIWWDKIYALLCDYLPNLEPSPKVFSTLQTFDIDMISAYQHKGLLHNVGGFAKQLMQGNWQGMLQRWQTCIKNQKDPFDAFQQMKEYVKADNPIIYFFLMANATSTYDKNLAPTHTAMQQLIESTANHFDIAIHPSYQSHENKNLLNQELQLLKQVSKKSISESRQHYIKFSLPHTFQQLIEADIEIDYSMGYGSINGFRASTCAPHTWFDVSANKATSLQIVPFCWMDANCVYEQKMDAEKALAEWLSYFETCKKHNGLFVDIWHNYILGNGNYNKEWMLIWKKTLDTINQSS